MRALYRSRLRVLQVMGVALVVVVLLAIGCGSADTEVETTQGSGNSSASGAMSSGVAYTGESSMEEVIAYAEAVARVRFRSARQTIEEIRFDFRNSDRYLTYYANSIEITFEVLEYLRGSGGDEIKAVLFDHDGLRETRAEVEALNENLLSLRTTQWDEREAIVLLHSGDGVVSTFNDPDRYWMTSFRNNGEDGYTVASRWEKAWLPDAAAQGATGRASGGEQRFLINLPSGSQDASGRSSTQGESMTISELKALVTRIGNELAAGGTEAYAECVRDKYRSARYEQYLKNHRETVWGVEYNRQHVKAITSGASSGTEVYVNSAADHIDADDIPDSLDIDDVILHTGQDADLFDKVWPANAVTTRPLPQGTYRFYWADQPKHYALCDAISEIRKKRNEVIVTVAPPPGTLHEAFFDPVTLGSGVGVDGSNGVINPASFSVSGTSTTISALNWRNGSVVLSLSSFSSLSGHKLDFIELDGSVSLSLPASSATEDTTAGTLTWTVSDRPWEDGDTLMLRISPSTTVPTPEPTPIPTAEPTPVPTAGITVTLSPRPLIPTDYINLSIRWVDPASCDSRYFVGIYNSSGTTIYRFYGYHPAPDTTSLERELGLLWDRIADLDWLVRVSCVPASGDESLVGEAELRSGLPETP